jgi:hypothetical protein
MIKVGDTIFVEDAWEDESGAYHDASAEVLSIDENGFMKLKFLREDVTEWLDGAEFHVDDYQDSKL